MSAGPETFGWQDAAACAGIPLDLFFGPEGEQQHEKPGREAAAKKVAPAARSALSALMTPWPAASGSACSVVPGRTSAG